MRGISRVATEVSKLFFPRSPLSPGGSALGQCFGQLGEKVPDLDDASLFVRAWKATQKLVREGALSAGHDISDGGLVTCVLEMAFAGNRGAEVSSMALIFLYWCPAEQLPVPLHMFSDCTTRKLYAHGMRLVR